MHHNTDKPVASGDNHGDVSPWSDAGTQNLYLIV